MEVKQSDQQNHYGKIHNHINIVDNKIIFDYIDFAFLCLMCSVERMSRKKIMSFETF